jgi:hypothetical protein
MHQFSTPRKQRVVRSHKDLFRELIRAYMHGSEARADNLIQQAMMGDEDMPKLIKSDADVLIGLAQDFVTTYRMMNFQKVEEEQKSSLHVI